MLKDIPTKGVAEFIRGLAKQHNVVYLKTSYDDLAEAITRLSDDDVVMDEVENLIIALERAGILPSEQVVPLHVNYLREKLQTFDASRRVDDALN
jgi:Ran GTPase-activating protein (RanGAP) involved in mRNA processing and transport